jgi:hypothetical protein
MNKNINRITRELAPLREQLRNHSLYRSLKSTDDIKVFMEMHVFAVWDFMSLLKALQINLTCVSLPWMPNKNSVLARFINEITVAEESDVSCKGEIKSHFEMYLDAMEEMHADAQQIHLFLEALREQSPLENALKELAIPKGVKEFVAFTFDVIKTNAPHKVAAAFTFGREDVIPDMFLKIVEETSSGKNNTHENFLYYLKRHIELDGDEHGPLSLEMVSVLCGDDEKKWEEVLKIAKQSLQVRINLWNSIQEKVEENQKELITV